MSRPVVVGITGTIGSGKSTVGDLIEHHGFKVFDTDHIVHQLFADNAELQRAIADRFGARILNERGEIDRTKLGSVVFADDEARKDLEAIVHPAVLEECRKIERRHATDKVIFLLVPLLFEAGIEERYDQIWTVSAKPEVLRERLKARTNLPDEEIDRRLAAQLPQAEKEARSHSVIDNSGTIEETAIQVDNLLRQFS